MRQLFALTTALGLVLLAAGLGRVLIGRRDAACQSSFECWSFSFALGLGTLAYLIFAAGLLGGFKPLPMLILFGALALSVVGCLLTRLKFNSFAFAPHPLFWAFFFFTLIAVIQALAPSTAHDALAYQLDIPKRFVQAGGMVYLPYGVNSTFPLLMNMYYVFALLWKSTELANLLHLAHGLGLAVGIFSLARGHLSKPYAMLAVLIFCLTPAVFNQMTIAYNDVAFCFYVFYAFYAAWRWSESRNSFWILLSGVFTGFALSVKYLGAFAGLLIGVFLLLALVKKEIKPGVFLKLSAVFGVAAALLSFVWYARCYFYEGQPLYFGQIGYEATNRPGFLNYAVLPWLATMFPERFGGSWAQIGPVYLAFLPLLFFVKEKTAWVKTCVYFGLGYFILWIFLPRQNLRFLFPALPFFSLAVAFGLEHVSFSVTVKRVLLVLLAGVLAVQALLFVYHGKKEYRAALGFESSEAYLTRQERTFGLANFMNKNLPANARVLNAYEVRMFYIDAHLIREPEYRAKSKYDRLAASPEEVLVFLKRDAFTHILWTPGGDADAPELSIAGLLSRRLLGADSLREIYREPAGTEADPKYLLYAIS